MFLPRDALYAMQMVYYATVVGIALACSSQGAGRTSIRTKGQVKQDKDPDNSGRFLDDRHVQVAGNSVDIVDVFTYRYVDSQINHTARWKPDRSVETHCCYS